MHRECSQMKSCKLIPARKMFLFNAVGEKKESCIFLVFIVFMAVRDVVLAGT